MFSQVTRRRRKKGRKEPHQASTTGNNPTCLKLGMGVWNVFRNCLEGVWQMSGGCLKGVLRMSEECLEGIYEMSEWYVGCLAVSEGQVRTSQVRIGV